MGSTTEILHFYTNAKTTLELRLKRHTNSLDVFKVILSKVVNFTK